MCHNISDKCRIQIDLTRSFDKSVSQNRYKSNESIIAEADSVAYHFGWLV